VLWDCGFTVLLLVYSVWCSFVLFLFTFSSSTCLHSLILNRRMTSWGLKWGTHKPYCCVLRAKSAMHRFWLHFIDQPIWFFKNISDHFKKRKHRPPKTADPSLCDYNDIATSSGFMVHGSWCLVSVSITTIWEWVIGVLVHHFSWFVNFFKKKSATVKKELSATYPASSCLISVMHFFLLCFCETCHFFS